MDWIFVQWKKNDRSNCNSRRKKWRWASRLSRTNKAFAYYLLLFRCYNFPIDAFLLLYCMFVIMFTCTYVYVCSRLLLIVKNNATKLVSSIFWDRSKDAATSPCTTYYLMQFELDLFLSRRNAYTSIQRIEFVSSYIHWLFPIPSEFGLQQTNNYTQEINLESIFYRMYLYFRWNKRTNNNNKKWLNNNGTEWAHLHTTTKTTTITTTLLLLLLLI